jgi:hypothetical protein
VSQFADVEKIVLSQFPYSLWLSFRWVERNIDREFALFTGIGQKNFIAIGLGTEMLFSFKKEKQLEVFMEYLKTLDLYVEGNLCQIQQKKSD